MELIGHESAPILTSNGSKMAEKTGKSGGPLPTQHVETLAQKLSDGQLAVFVGAGLSHLASPSDGSARRLPLWKELTDQVAKACRIDSADFGHDPLDVFDAIVHADSRGALEEAVREALDDSNFDLSAAHLTFQELPWAAVLTTNYDKLLERLLKEAPVYDEQDYDRLSDRKRPRLFHIHGTLERLHTLTRDDYREWQEKHPRAFSHLRQLVDEKTVLFVGYSLSDPHLDELLATVRRITRGREKRLYGWMWHISQAKINLLDRRDKITAISIEREEDWAHAFHQLVGEFGRRQGGGDIPPSISSQRAYAYAREQYYLGLSARYGIANLQALYQWGEAYARDDVRLSEVFVEPDLEDADGAKMVSVMPRPR
jgi:hypothetical protein